MSKIFRLLIFALMLAFAGGALAQEAPDWTNVFPPYRIIGNIYYVGSQGLAFYLITTPQGNILINSNLEKSVPMI
jgi:metallo-beta-lactamase class B